MLINIMMFNAVLLAALFQSLFAFAADSMEPEDYTSRFSLEEGHTTLEYLADALTSFRELTEKSPKELTEKSAIQVGIFKT